MHYSSKPQRLNGNIKNRNGQMPPTYNTGVHFLSAPSVSNTGQLQMNRKYINSMGNINEVAVLQYQRSGNMQMKNHNLEINHFQSIRHQQSQAFVYKTPQFHNHLNPNMPQNYPVNHPMQRKLYKEQAPAIDVLQQPYKNVEFSSKRSKELLNQQEANKLNNLNNAMPNDVRKLSSKEGNGRMEESKFPNEKADDVKIVKQKVPTNIGESEKEGIKDNNGNADVLDKDQAADTCNENSEKDHCEEVNDKSTKDSREKTPMCLINDLARFNKISFQYRLTSENGPAHCKRFTVTLKLGDEEYTAEGYKIKKAQHSAAKEAIEKTKYKHPMPKTNDILKSNITPTVELNALAMKLGQQTYYIFDSQQVVNYSNYRFATIQESPSGVVENLSSNGTQFQNPNHRRQFLSKFQHRYAPFQHSIQSTSVPADRTCFPYSSPCKITLLVGTKQFVGVGRTLQQAKHDAASNALQVLKEEMHNEQLQTHDESMEDNDNNKSPISLVFEMGIKRNLPVDFKVLREEGPAHMRTFITACTVGDIKTEGMGNGKKISKKKAAQKMLEELKKLPPLTAVESPVKRPKLKISKKKCSARPKNNNNLVEHKDDLQKSCHKEVTTENEAESPINKLLEWHQNKKKKEPLFKLVNEFGKENSHKRQFVMEVSSNKIVARGVGNSKKLAKQDAAKKCLMALTESEQQPPATSEENDSITKAANTCEVKETLTEPTSHKPLREEACKTLPQNKESHKKQENVDDPTTNATSSTDVTVAASKESTNDTTTPSKSKNLHMKDQLMYLSKLLSFDVEFSDYPKGNHNEFLTIVMLSTNPPQICHGVGVNAKESQEDAAKNALKILCEMGLNNAVNS